MAHATKATTALVAVALGLATVTAAFVTVSSTASVADPATVKIQDRLRSDVRLIAIDAPEDTVVHSNLAAAETVAVRMIPLPSRAPRPAAGAGEPMVAASADEGAATKGDRSPAAGFADVPLPPAKPFEIAAIDPAAVPLPQPRPDPELIVGALSLPDVAAPH